MEINWNTQFDNMLSHHSSQNLKISTDFLNTCNFNHIFGNAQTLLEIGCGTGELSKLLSEKFTNLKIVATDYAKSSIDYANTNYKKDSVTYKQLDIIKEEIEENYDVIISSNTLEHFKNYKLIINKILPKCKYAIFIIPHHETLNDLHLYEYEGGICHCSSFTLNSFNEYSLLSSYDFTTDGWFGPNSNSQLTVLLKGNI